MSYTIILTPLAMREVKEAIAWYTTESPAIAGRFQAELDALFDRLRSGPYQFPSIWRGVRKASFRRFPYVLMFRVLDRQVDVFACFHTSRDPAIWRRRL